MAVACRPVSKLSPPEDDIEQTKVDAVPAAALVALGRHDSNVRELRRPMPPRPASRPVPPPPRPVAMPVTALAVTGAAVTVPPLVVDAVVAKPSVPPPLPSRAPAPAAAPAMPRAARTEPITLLPDDLREIRAGIEGIEGLEGIGGLEDGDEPSLDAFAPRPLLKLKTLAKTTLIFAVAVASALKAWATTTFPIVRARARQEWNLAKAKAKASSQRQG